MILKGKEEDETPSHQPPLPVREIPIFSGSK